jgi:tetrahydromethanopterin S-methyltransferase subunit D
MNTFTIHPQPTATLTRGRSARPDLRRILTSVIAAGSVAVVGIGALPAAEARAAGVVVGVRHLYSTSA